MKTILTCSYVLVGNFLYNYNLYPVETLNITFKGYEKPVKVLKYYIPEYILDKIMVNVSGHYDIDNSYIELYSERFAYV